MATLAGDIAVAWQWRSSKEFCNVRPSCALSVIKLHKENKFHTRARRFIIQSKGGDASESNGKPSRRKKSTPKDTSSLKDKKQQSTVKPKKSTKSKRKDVEQESTEVKEKKPSSRKKVKENETISKEEERWKLMEYEKQRILDGKFLDPSEYANDEDEEEEEDEDETDDADEDVEEKTISNGVEVEFPDEPCYALTKSYKPRKIGKDEKPPLTNDELWWSAKNIEPDEHYWSEYQKRPGLPEITLAAMSALTGQIKLFGDTPSVTETHIYRARKFVFKEERLKAEEARRKEIGPVAYYQEWVKAWDKDTSKEAVQKHYEETGEDEALQLMNMLAHQTKAEYNHMMGTDIRIRRDPLEMRATDEMKRSVFGGDPVYPTINYIKDPDAVIDYRGPNFHQPRPSVVEHLIRIGRMKTREEHNRIMALQQERIAAEEAMAEDEEEQAVEEMATAIDIGEKEDEDDDDIETFKDVEAFKEEGEEEDVVPTAEKLIQLSEEDEPDDENGNV